MSVQTTTFCDACLGEILPPKPGESWEPKLRLARTGDVGLLRELPSETHFHNVACLRRFLDEHAP